MKTPSPRRVLQWAASLCFIGMTMYAFLSTPRWTAHGLQELAFGWMTLHAEQSDLECEDYDASTKDPSRAHGKPVRWFISHPGPAWFCGDDQSRPIRWSSGPPDMMETGQSGQSRGRWIRGTVDSADPRGVVLAFDRFD